MALIKHGMKTSFIDSFVDRVRTGQSRYYYCLGQPDSWQDENVPPQPENSESYEQMVRSSIITAKQVNFIDVSKVVRRIDWSFGTVYDMYDDNFTVGVRGA
jgi:hypothetical protein